MNDFLNQNRQIVAERLVQLARQIYIGANCDCFILGDHLISLMVEPIKDFEPQTLSIPNEPE